MTLTAMELFTAHAARYERSAQDEMTAVADHLGPHVATARAARRRWSLRGRLAALRSGRGTRLATDRVIKASPGLTEAAG